MVVHLYEHIKMHGVCMYAQVYVGMLTYGGTCEGQRLMSGHLNHSQYYFLRQGLSVILELSTGQGPACLCYRVLESQTFMFMLGM